MHDAVFDRMVREAYESLPPTFREVCDEVLLQTEDFAEQEVLDSLGIEDPYNLLGLYHGINQMNKSVFDLPSQPDRVMIYRQPILSYAKTQNLHLEDVIRNVVVHEYGHHMGFSDEDMHEIEFGQAQNNT